jgi:hypothetical protein
MEGLGQLKGPQIPRWQVWKEFQTNEVLSFEPDLPFIRLVEAGDQVEAVVFPAPFGPIWP